MFGQTDNNRPQAAFAIWRDEDGQWWAQARSAAAAACFGTEKLKFDAFSMQGFSTEEIAAPTPKEPKP